MGFVALVLAVMLVVGSLGTLGGYLAFRHRSRSQPSPTALPPSVAPTFPGPALRGPTPTTRPRDPSASALDSLVMTQADVESTVLVQPIPNGTEVSPDAATLDLCDGSFPSESERSARLQVVAIDGVATSLISTEAVLYAHPGATEQGFAELKSAAASCPATVAHFNGAPDGAWTATPTVTRMAFDMEQSDVFGNTEHFVAVYLRRGRVLMGVYFYVPDSTQITVAGQNTVEKIAGVFAQRMANLPASVVNG